MHPFLPVLSIVLLAMGDAAAFFLWRFGNDPDVVAHRPSLWALTGVAILFGAALAFWLRRFHLRFPSYAAMISLIGSILLVNLGRGR